LVEQPRQRHACLEDRDLDVEPLETLLGEVGDGREATAEKIVKDVMELSTKAAAIDACDKPAVEGGNDRDLIKLVLGRQIGYWGIRLVDVGVSGGVVGLAIIIIIVVVVVILLIF
ncbi:hypothetical protein H0H87_003946, partial [Tephrocybe sp. NHM501043]